MTVNPAMYRRFRLVLAGPEGLRRLAFALVGDVTGLGRSGAGSDKDPNPRLGGEMVRSFV